MDVFGSATRTVAEAALSTMPYINCAMGLVVAGFALHRLLCCASQYTRAERAGMGFLASGMILATPALWMENTPFDGWSFNIARAGVVIYIITGGLRRDRHRRLNMRQAAYGEGFRDGRAATKGMTPQ